jgi:HEAT repeat protein
MMMALIVMATFVGCGQPAAPKTAHYRPVSHWVKALKDPDAKVRRKAVRILGNVGTNDAAVIPSLIVALRDADVNVRNEAIVALMKIGAPAKEAIATLENIKAHDADAKGREYAGKAIDRIGNDSP